MRAGRLVRGQQNLGSMLGKQGYAIIHRDYRKEKSAMVKKIDDEVIVGDDNNGNETALNTDLNQVVKEIIREVTPEPSQDGVQDLAILDTIDTSRLRDAFDKIDQSDANNIDADLRATIGSFHFRLRKAVYDSLIITASLSASVATAVASHGLGAVTIVGAVVDAIDRFQENITKLSPSELLVYSAVVKI